MKNISKISSFIALISAASMPLMAHCETRNIYNYTNYDVKVYFPLSRCKIDFMIIPPLTPGQANSVHEYEPCGGAIVIEYLYKGVAYYGPLGAYFFNTGLGHDHDSKYITHNGNTWPAVLNNPANGDIILLPVLPIQ